MHSRVSISLAWIYFLPFFILIQTGMLNKTPQLIIFWPYFLFFETRTVRVSVKELLKSFENMAGKKGLVMFDHIKDI